MREFPTRPWLGTPALKPEILKFSLVTTTTTSV